MSEKAPQTEVSFARSAAWTLFIVPFFFLVYGLCNWYTAQRPAVGTFAWDWEQGIPFVPSMMLPYLSMNLFYAASPFFCRTRHELRVLVSRIIFAIVAAGICFLLFPLKLAFVRPPMTGVYGWILDWLRLDEPFNTLPSLHIAFCFIVWEPYGRLLRGWARAALRLWFCIIALSAVLTYQHQIIDIAGGLALAILAIYLFPMHHPSPLFFREPYHRKLGPMYASFAGLMLFAAIARWPRGALFLWPASSLAIFALAYSGVGPASFQKWKGRLSWPARILLAPVLGSKFISLAIYQRRNPAIAEVVPGILLGSYLSARRVGPDVSVLDATPELSEWPRLRNDNYCNIQFLDLTVPTMEQLEAGVAYLKQQTAQGPVFVHCALGYSRSAGIIAAYLLDSGIATTPEDAIAKIQRARPQIVLRWSWVELLRTYAARHVRAL